MDVATAPPPSTNVNEFSQGPTNTVQESDTSSSNQIVHSSYVPAQLHRHLQFLDFNSGKLNCKGIKYDQITKI